MTKLRLKYVLGFVVLLVGLAVWVSGCFDSPRSKADKWIAAFHLAPLPTSATNIAFHQWSGLFTGETYIKIQMDSNDLASFITNSPVLAQSKLELFSRDHQHLPFPQQQSLSFDTTHAYYTRRANLPQWFDLTITNAGRRYEIWPDKRVYINEETATIYLHIIKG